MLILKRHTRKEKKKKKEEARRFPRLLTGGGACRECALSLFVMPRTQWDSYPHHHLSGFRVPQNRPVSPS